MIFYILFFISSLSFLVFTSFTKPARLLSLVRRWQKPPDILSVSPSSAWVGHVRAPPASTRPPGCRRPPAGPPSSETFSSAARELPGSLQTMRVLSCAPCPESSWFLLLVTVADVFFVLQDNWHFPVCWDSLEVCEISRTICHDYLV